MISWFLLLAATSYGRIRNQHLTRNRRDTTGDNCKDLNNVGCRILKSFFEVEKGNESCAQPMFAKNCPSLCPPCVQVSPPQHVSCHQTENIGLGLSCTLWELKKYPMQILFSLLGTNNVCITLTFFLLIVMRCLLQTSHYQYYSS